MIKLSPSSLNIFLECPRCFWLQMNRRIKRPRGIFPSLPGGMDLVIKKYFDKYRIKDELPPEIKGRVEGKLFNNLALLERWRSWRTTDLRYEDKPLNVSLSGALDDCLVDGNYYIPLDYKTRGSALKGDPRKYYQNQLDCYCLMLESKGYRTKGISYLLYYYPQFVKENGIVKFEVKPIKIETNIKTAERTVKNAIELLSEKDMPQPGPNCEYCNWLNKRNQPVQGSLPGLFEEK